MNIVLLGPPGAGKGTQAKAINQENGIGHVSTGDILRDAVAKGTELGLKAKSYMDSGALVPDDLVIALVAQRLKAADCAGGFILDGFPRTAAQAEALEKTLAKAGKALDRVVYFKVDDEQVVRRLSGRRMCRGCGANYHTEFMPSGKGDKCDKCGGELYQREDDRPQTIRKRLQVYYRQTAELIRYYTGKGLLAEVDAMRAPGQVAQDVKQVLGASG